jgi:enoyl-CoA hydratase/carnithine racemase
MSIRTGTVDGVATIEIARPEKKNALTVEMYQAMADAIVAAGDRRRCGARVLITGQPGIFTSGNDIEDFMSRPGRAAAQDSPVFQFMRALVDCDKPVVAAVTGAAIGIGTTMLLHCDFVYVADDARLAMPFAGLGLVPEFASSLLVPQLMGHRRAAEKLLLGDPFTAEHGGGMRHRQRRAARRRGGERTRAAWPNASMRCRPGRCASPSDCFARRCATPCWRRSAPRARPSAAA